MSEKQNEKLQEAINEAVLQAAFTEAAEQELAELEAMDIEVPQPTEKQRKEVEKAMRDTCRKEKRGTSRVWRAVAMFAIFFCVAASIIMIQPTVRASVWDFIVSVYEKYLSFDFDEEETNANFEFGEHTITYIPNGYIGGDVQNTPLKSKITFTNPEEAFSITVFPTAISSLNVDREQGTTESLRINDYSGYIVQYEETEQKELIWGDDTYTFIIRGSLSKKEMIKIAENIK